MIPSSVPHSFQIFTDFIPEILEVCVFSIGFRGMYRGVEPGTAIGVPVGISTRVTLRISPVINSRFLLQKFSGFHPEFFKVWDFPKSLS